MYWIVFGITLPSIIILLFVARHINKNLEMYMQSCKLFLVICFGVFIAIIGISALCVYYTRRCEFQPIGWNELYAHIEHNPEYTHQERLSARIVTAPAVDVINFIKLAEEVGICYDTIQRDTMKKVRSIQYRQCGFCTSLYYKLFS